MSVQYSRRKKILLTFLPVLIFIGFLASVEIAIRLTKPHMSLLYYMFSLSNLVELGEQDLNVEEIKEGDPVLGWKFIPNKKNVLWEKTYVTTNSKGMRYDKEVGPKEPGTVRIAAYGDSISFGWRIPMIETDEKVPPADQKNNEKSYWMWLEDKLSMIYPYKNIEAMSFGVPGYSTYQGYESMKRSIGWANPDIVIIQFAANDQNISFNKVKMFNQEDKVILDNSLLAVSGKKVLASSQALMHFSHFFFKARPDIEYDFTTRKRVSQEDYVKNTLAMCKLVKDNGGTPIVILPIYRDPEIQGKLGYYYGQYRDALREALKQTDCLSIEIKELTGAGSPNNASLFLEHIHPNSEGHNLMATRIADLIQSKNLIK